MQCGFRFLVFDEPVRAPLNLTVASTSLPSADASESNITALVANG